MKPILIAVLSSLLVNACGGQFAYKRGANVADFESVKRTCSAQAGDSAQMEKCMEAQGWVVQGFNQQDSIYDAPDPVANAIVTPDNRTGIASQNDQSNARPVAVKPLPNPVSQTNSSQATSTSQSSTAFQSIEPVAAKKPANPMDTFKVSSWWKMGGGGENWKVAINECVSTLGDAHRPEEKTQMVTRGLLVCMDGKGWRGLRTK